MTEPMLDPKHDEGSGAPGDQGGRSAWGLLLLAAIVALVVTGTGHLSWRSSAWRC